MQNALELYGAQTGNCIRAAIALEEAGIAYSARPVNLATGEHQGQELRSLNPFGKVPVLVQRASGAGFVLAQSNAIILFAAEFSPTTLLPADPVARAKVYERFFYFLTDVIAVSHGAFKLQQIGASEQAKSINELAVSALLEGGRFLAFSPFMAGESFSVADIAAFTIARAYYDAIEWGEHPELAHWYAEVARRPAVLRGLKVFA
ncbi:glutathione S-transferase family protein [Cupriavidus basilensis]|uniref:glutathione S-transferase family protein n=1 Tax=Cupriavidus basilensis TaxID=68895 RepID=UPI0023E7F191|nr:glutathione S-transferase family protein [Cupriavidus basilensis]MDF3887173.1 glutathione S-transferase family protein [Cupriavidus basilensis]